MLMHVLIGWCALLPGHFNSFKLVPPAWSNLVDTCSLPLPWSLVWLLTSFSGIWVLYSHALWIFFALRSWMVLHWVSGILSPSFALLVVTCATSTISITLSLYSHLPMALPFLCPPTHMLPLCNSVWSPCLVLRKDSRRVLLHTLKEGSAWLQGGILICLACLWLDTLVHTWSVLPLSDLWSFWHWNCCLFFDTLQLYILCYVSCGITPMGLQLFLTTNLCGWISQLWLWDEKWSNLQLVL